MSGKAFAIALNVAYDDPNGNFIFGGVGLGELDKAVARAASGTSRHTDEGLAME